YIKGKALKLKNHPGFKRLALVITFASFVITYFSLSLVTIDDVGPAKEDLVLFLVVTPIVSALIALITFVFVRIIYWVVDGFKNVE
ncbi:MAG: hypothetical protein ACE5HX_10475, partial [bacterium]